MLIKWSKDLETGIDGVDKQHRGLFKAVNNLLESCKEHRGKDEVDKMLSYLKRYVIEHFNAEELIQKEYNYTRYESHKKEHENFVKELAELKQQFEQKGATVSVIATVNHKVVRWLIKHIRYSDKDFAKYIKEKKLN